MENNKEIRNNIITCSKETRQVEGLAVVFESDSTDMGFVEQIKRGAITEETIGNSDVFVYLNHEHERGVLARSRYGQGTLKLDLREDGLYYSFEAPKTQLGDELLNYLERGEITTSSFAFTIDPEGGDKWYRDSNNKLRRDIYHIKRLYDVSPVFEPAYPATNVTARKLDEINQLDEKLDALQEEIDKI